jgi:hypothetical protein
MSYGSMELKLVPWRQYWEVLSLPTAVFIKSALPVSSPRFWQTPS